MSLNLSDLRSLANSRLTIKQAYQRKAILVNLEMELDLEGKELNSKDSKELQALNDILNRHQRQGLTGTVGVPRLSSGADFYRIAFTQPVIYEEEPIEMVPYPTTKINTPDDILPACQQEAIRGQIISCQKWYQFNLEEGAQRLDNAGSTLALIMAATRDANVRSDLTSQITLKYRSITTNSSIFCNLIGLYCVDTLKKYKFALAWLEKGNYDKMKMQLEKANENLDDIVQTCVEVIMECQQLDKLCQKLSRNIRSNYEIEGNLMKNHSESQTKWKTQQEQSQKAIEVSQKQINILHMSMQQKKQKYNKDVQQIQQKIKDHPQMQIDIDLSKFGKSQSLLESTIKGAKEGCELGGLIKPGIGHAIGASAGVVVGFISAIFSNNREKQLLEASLKKLAAQEKQDARNQEERMKLYDQLTDLLKQYNEMEKKLQDKERQQAKIQLQGYYRKIQSINQLQYLSLQNKKNQVALLSLKICSEYLTIIRTTFQDSKKFWEIVQRQSKTRFQKLQLTTDPQLKNKLGNEIKKLGLQWLTLGKIGNEGRKRMDKLKADIDCRLLALPTEANLQEYVHRLCQSLGSQYRLQSEQLMSKYNLKKN